MMNRGNLYINLNSTIFEALRGLEVGKRQFLIVVDDDMIVCGVITDGDLRRAILNGGGFDTCIKNFIKREFKYLTKESSFDDVCGCFKDEKISFLPIVDYNMKLINVMTKKDFHVILLEDKKFDVEMDFSACENVILEHEIYNRPWGFYKSIVYTSNAQSKIITVFPRSELSLQEHKKREEHWVMIKGNGVVVLGESEIDVYSGKYIYIPKGCKHQIINNSDENLVFVEVQLGSYFGEDDIIRHSDKYNRK